MENLQEHEKNEIKWKCLHCETEHVSHPHMRHCMDVCQCGESGVDAEEHYTRVFGKVKFLEDE